jgi:hypothetical protein
MAFTKQNSRLVRFQADPVYAADGTVSAVPIQTYLKAKLVNDADPQDSVDAAAKQVDFNLLDPAIMDTTITAAGKTVTYKELAALIRKACLDRANAAGVT